MPTTRRLLEVFVIVSSMVSLMSGSGGLFLEQAAEAGGSNTTSTTGTNMTAIGNMTGATNMTGAGNMTQTSNMTEAAANDTGNISAVKKPSVTPGDPCCVAPKE